MKVVFIENVPQVANAGDVKEVKNGYGRNYLLPRKLAVPATASALKQLEQQHQAADKKASKLESEAEKMARQLDGKTIEISVKSGSQGRLYGAVTNAHLAEELEKVTGQAVDRRRVHLEEPIRRLGSYPVTVRLSSDVSAIVTVEVRGESEAAAEPAKKPAARKTRASTKRATESETAEEAE